MELQQTGGGGQMWWDKVERVIMEMNEANWKRVPVNTGPPTQRKISLSPVKLLHLMKQKLTEDRENIKDGRRIDFKFLTFANQIHRNDTGRDTTIEKWKVESKNLLNWAKK